ncbi:MAG: head GIN domain-containing protein [Pyrinomonadaceae bacterium]|nr:head GIN domain-containing protein [Pyrinomonadaceae bacterium]
MKKIGILIFAVAVLIGVAFANVFSFGRVELPAFNISFGKGVKGSGNVVTENRQLSNFTSIEAGGIFNVQVTAQKEFSVQVEADDNILPLIKTEVLNGKLVISSETRFRSSNRIVVRVTAPDISRVDMSGASKLDLNNVKNGELTLGTSGASKATVSGETALLRIDVSGASKVDASGLRAENAKIDASGASKALVNVAGDLKASASGASKINYSGTPRNIEKETNGASKVSQD